MKYLIALLLICSTGNAQTIKDGAIVTRMLNDQTFSSVSDMNIGLAASVGSNALTIELKQKDGLTNPTSLAPSTISFRKATVTDGGFDIVKITSALSITIPSGTTIGTQDGVAETIYVYLINNAGTAELALCISCNIDEGNVVSTTAISGGTSRTTIYSMTARTNVPIRLIGKIVSTQATAGTWATSPALVSPTAEKSAWGQIYLYNANGYGSTATKIRKYNSVVDQSNGYMTLTQSATNGDSITINKAGVYYVSALDGTTSGSQSGGCVGFTVDASSLTTNLTSLNYETGNRCQQFIPPSSPATPQNCSNALYLYEGQILRNHSDGNNNSSGRETFFTITYVGG